MKKWQKNMYIHHFDDDVNYPDVLKAITVGVQKGAEFGYNRVNEELEEKISGIDAEAEIAKES